MSKRIIFAPLLLLILATMVSAQTAGAGAGGSAALAATEELLTEVGHLRQLKVLRPVSSGLRSRQEIELIIKQSFDESATPEEIEAQRKLLVAFGLVPGDFRYRDFMISMLTEQVAGFYQPKTKQFFLADWNDFEQVKPVMVHELTHALQDQHFDLGRFEKWPRGDSDRELAIQALIEGDAMAVMLNYLLQPNGLDITRLPASLTQLNEMMRTAAFSEGDKVLASAPAVIRESVIFPYAFGAGFAQEVIRRQKWEGLSRAYTNLPQSTEQIMHPEKYLNGESPVRIELAEMSPLFGNGWKRLSTDINGEFGYLLILSEYIARTEAQRATAGWGGDRCALYENEKTGDLLVVHLSAWDSRSDAEEFFRAYSKRTSKLYSQAASTASNTQFIANSQKGAYIEIRDNRVLVIDGLPTQLKPQLRRLATALWK